MIDVADIERRCLERFFLEPGENGPVRGVRAADDALVEMLGTADLAGAVAILKASLPQAKMLSRILAGHVEPPKRSGRPFYVRVLVFLCWMQVTRRRTSGNRNFREIFEEQFGLYFERMDGLPRLWRDLAEHLSTEHAIDLVVPPPGNQVLIGHTLRMSFPTWRDKRLLRAAAHILSKSEAHLDRNELAKLVTTSPHLEKGSHALQHAFAAWERAFRIGDPSRDELPFWKAWTGVLAERGRRDQIEIVEREYGEFSLATVTVDGRREGFIEIDAIRKFLDPRTAKDLRSGYVFLRPCGFGRYQTDPDLKSNHFLVASSKLDAAEVERLGARTVCVGWSLVELDLPEQPVADVAPGAGAWRWRHGLRVGKSYLGRHPLAPCVEFSGKETPSFRFDGEGLTPQVRDGVAFLPPLPTPGKLVVELGGEKGTRNLVPWAVEHSPDQVRRAKPDDWPEDGKLWGTTPFPVRHPSWNGDRVEPDPVMTTICEALYAKCARPMGLGDAFQIVSRALDHAQHAPSAWDVLRSLCDAAWIEVRLSRDGKFKTVSAPGTGLVMSLQGDETLGVVDGPVPHEMARRLRGCADMAGVGFAEYGGLGPWSPRTCVVSALDSKAWNRFLDRSGLHVLPTYATPPSLETWSDDIAPQGYAVARSWNERGGYFVVGAEAATGGLTVHEHPHPTQQDVYVSRLPGLSEARFRSASVALLAHAVRKEQAVLSFVGGKLRPLAGGIRLPSSWARALRARHACAAGPSIAGSGWTYAYPADARTAALLAKQMRLDGLGTAIPSWAAHAGASASSSGRILHVPGVGTIDPRRHTPTGGRIDA